MANTSQLLSSSLFYPELEIQLSEEEKLISANLPDKEFAIKTKPSNNVKEPNEQENHSEDLHKDLFVDHTNLNYKLNSEHSSSRINNHDEFSQNSTKFINDVDNCKNLNHDNSVSIDESTQQLISGSLYINTNIDNSNDTQGVNITNEFSSSLVLKETPFLDKSDETVDGTLQEITYNTENNNENANNTEGLSTLAVRDFPEVSILYDGKMFLSRLDLTSNKNTFSQVVDTKVSLIYKELKRLKLVQRHIEAVGVLERAIYLEPSRACFYEETAECFLQACDIHSCILYYKKALLLSPQNEFYKKRLAFAYLLHAQSLFDLRLYSESLDAFRNGSELDPDNEIYHTRALSCLAALGRHSECLSIITDKLEVDKHNVDLWVTRAHLYQISNDLPNVYYDLKQAINLDPKNSEACLIMSRQQGLADDCKLLAMRHFVKGKYHASLAKISKTVAIIPADPEVYLLRGIIYRHLENYNLALDDFLESINKAKETGETEGVLKVAQHQIIITYNEFAIKCFEKGYVNESIKLLNKAIEGEKREKGLYINRGDCFYRQNDLVFALQDYHQAHDLDTADVNISRRLSVIYSQLGSLAALSAFHSEAEAKFTQAIKYNPCECSNYVARSRMRYILKNEDNARVDLIMALLLNPNNEDIPSIHSCLFPGKSFFEVITSEAAQRLMISEAHLFQKEEIETANINSPKTEHSRDYKKAASSFDAKHGDIPLSPRRNTEVKSSMPKSEILLCVNDWQDMKKWLIDKKSINYDFRKEYENKSKFDLARVDLQPLKKYTLGLQ